MDPLNFQPNTPRPPPSWQPRFNPPGPWFGGRCRFLRLYLPLLHFIWHTLCLCICQAEQSATIVGRCADPDSAEDIDCFTAPYLQPVTWWTFVSWIIVSRGVLKLHRSETIAENLGIGAIPPRRFAQSVACLKISWSRRSHTRRPIDVWKLVKFPSVSSAGPKDPTIGQIWIVRYKKPVTKVKVPEAPKFGSQQKQYAAIQRYQI